MRFAAQELHSADQQPFHKITKGTHADPRTTLLPAAGMPVQTDVKRAKIVTCMTDARLKLDEGLQCMVFARK